MNHIVQIENGYSAEFDTINKSEWCKIIKDFSDASVFQTWAYDEIRNGEDNISHFILRRDGEVVAAAQSRILRISTIGFGVAYIRWGPLWQLRNKPVDLSIFSMAVRALRKEYVCRRGLVLRIFPILYNDNSNAYSQVFMKAGYRRISGKDPSRTLILDIRPTMEELRKQLSRRWRRCLRKAEQNNLEIVEGTGDNLFEDFICIYEQMIRRKRFARPNDINEFRMVQREQPPEYKMNVFLCQSKGEGSAGGIFSAVGETGVYLFGATNKEGMSNNGSYLVHWKAIKWMKRCGCQFYNLYGINPKRNMGTYVFKAGLAGKEGMDVYYLGRFDSYPNWASDVIAHVGDFLSPHIRRLGFLRKSIIRIPQKD